MLLASNGRGIELLVLIVVFGIFATAAVGLRLWARRLRRQRLITSGYLCIVGWVFTAAFVAAEIYAIVDGGIGQHLKTITHEQRFVILKVYKVGWLLWATGCTAVRLSMSSLLGTIFATTRNFQYAAYTLMALATMWYTGVFTTFFAICRPFSFYWRSDIKGKCGNLYFSFLLAAIFNLILDLGIIILPMPLLWKLQMSKGRKFILMGIFGIGAAICIITMLRINAVIEFAKVSAKKDFSYTIFYDGLWSTLENCLGIISCTLPLLRPVARQCAESKLWLSLTSQVRRLASRRSRSRTYASSKPSINTRHYEQDVASNFRGHASPKKIPREPDLYPLTSLGSMSAEHPIPELMVYERAGEAAA